MISPKNDLAHDAPGAAQNHQPPQFKKRLSLLFNSLKANRQLQISMGVVAAFAVIGTLMIVNSRAATYAVPKELESGTAAGKYAATADANASGGQYIKFGVGGGGTTPPTTPPPSGNWDPRQPGPDDLFTATDGSPNYFRSTIPANPKLDGNSSAIVGSIGSNYPKLNGPDWQITVFTASNSDPSYSPKFSQASWGCSVGGSIHIPDYATREIPGGSGGDGWVVIYNKDDKTVKSIWQASKSGSTWSGACGGSWPAASGGGHESMTGVGTGADVQAGAGFILNSELQSGAINHALYFTSTNSCSSFRAPAGKSDGNGGGGSCAPMGARMQLDPTVDCNGLSGASKGEKMVCVTMQKYGGYILDSGGPGPISGIGMAGDDMTDPGRSPWQTPGNGFRGSNGCTPGPSCGIVASVGLTGSLSHIPWNKLRVLASWNGQ